MQKKQPAREPRSLVLLKAMSEAINGLAGKKDSSENTVLLQSIEGLLKQLIAIYSMPKQEAAQEIAHPPNWRFIVNRDSKGRMESIDAIRQPSEG